MWRILFHPWIRSHKSGNTSPKLWPPWHSCLALPNRWLPATIPCSKILASLGSLPGKFLQALMDMSFGGREPPASFAWGTQHVSPSGANHLPHGFSHYCTDLLRTAAAGWTHRWVERTCLGLFWESLGATGPPSYSAQPWPTLTEIHSLRRWQWNCGTNHDPGP